jgi:hypothetical protein
MVRRFELSPDHLSHTLQGPQVSVVPLGLRSGEQNGLQPTQFVAGQFAFATGASSARQRLFSDRFPDAMPAAGRLPTDLQSPGDFRLRTSVGKQTPGPNPTLLFGRVVRATLRIPFHTAGIS